MATEKRYLYFDKKGKPCDAGTAVLCVIQTVDRSGKVLQETEISITEEETKNNKG